MTSTEFDPVLSPAKAAEYCATSVKTLRRLKVERAPIPCTGTKRQKFGYRLSVLNALLASLANPKARQFTVIRRQSA